MLQAPMMTLRSITYNMGTACDAPIDTSKLKIQQLIKSRCIN
jgi:hypothetical protein